MIKQKILQATILLSLILSSSLFASWFESKATGKFEKKITLEKNISELKIIQGSGDVQIHTGQNNEIIVKGNVRVSASKESKATEILDGLIKNPPIAIRGEVLEIGDKGFNRSIFDEPKVEIDYEIIVPKKIKTSIDIGSGDVFIKDINGPIEVDGGSGKVMIENISSDVKFNMGSGNASLKKIEGKIDGGTGSGDITVSETGGNIDVEAGSGKISIVDIKGNIKTETGSGNVTIKNARKNISTETGSGDITIESSITDHADWQFETGSGNAKITLPPASKFEVDLDSSGGDIDVKFPVTIISKQKRGRLLGKIADGTAKITVETGSGDITINKTN